MSEIIIKEMFSVKVPKSPPKSNYTSYDILSLRTRLVPYLEKMYGPGAYPVFGDKIVEERVYMTMLPTIGSKYINMKDSELSKLKDIIDSLISQGFEYALLSPIKDYMSKRYGRIPKSWVKNIMRFVNVPEIYRPYMSDNGLMVSVVMEEEPHRIFSDLTVNVNEQIVAMYEGGVMYMNDGQIIDDWGYEQVDSKYNLFQPTWKDNRITDSYSGPVGFIRSRLEGNKTISVYVGSAPYIRHSVSKLFPCNFIGEHVRFKVENIEDARIKLTKIPISLSKFHGTVISIGVSGPRQAKRYVSLMKKQMDNPDITTYKTASGYFVSYVTKYQIDADFEKDNIIMSFLQDIESSS